MKAKELRIGSWVKAERINQFRVDEIYISEHQGYVLRMYIDLQRRSYLDLPLSMAIPIEITEEILLKSGFEKTEGLKCYGEDIYSIGLSKDIHGHICGSEVSVSFEGCQLFFVLNICEDHDYITTGTEIKGLHRLQNIVYDLTGKELEIKL